MVSFTKVSVSNCPIFHTNKQQTKNKQKKNMREKWKNNVGLDFTDVITFTQTNTTSIVVFSHYGFGTFTSLSSLIILVPSL